MEHQLWEEEGENREGGGDLEGKVLLNCCTPWLSSIKYTYYIYRYIHVGIAGHIPASSTSPSEDTGSRRLAGAEEWALRNCMDTHQTQCGAQHDCT